MLDATNGFALAYPLSHGVLYSRNVLLAEPPAAVASRPHCLTRQYALRKRVEWPILRHGQSDYRTHPERQAGVLFLHSFNECSTRLRVFVRDIPEAGREATTVYPTAGSGRFSQLVRDIKAMLLQQRQMNVMRRSVD